jgi:AAA family ATP:ADP antiporter
VGGRALDALGELRRSPYLRRVCAYLLLGTVTGTLLYFAQAAIVERRAGSGARVEAFAWIDLSAQGVTLLVQALFTARIVRGLGVGGTLALLPLVTVAGFSALIAAPVYGVIFAVQTARRAGQYALATPAREVLFQVLTRSEKYKAKALIDTFVYRFGDLLGALLVIGLAGLGLGGVAGAATGGAIAIGLCVAWVGVALALGRSLRRREEAQPRGIPVAPPPAAATFPPPP